MTQVKGCVKLSLIVSNIFFAIVGCAIIAFALVLQLATRFNDISLEGYDTGLVLLYVVGTITLLIAALGAYGALRQSRAALIAFLVCMVIGTLMMMRVGIPLAAVRPEMQGMMTANARKLLPLDEADPKTKQIVDGVQEMFQCCGVFGVDDWRLDIPDSCLCDEAAHADGICRDVDYSLMLQMKKSVFRQPCFPLVATYVFLILDVAIGVVFALALLALLGLTLSSVLLHQLRKGGRPAVMLVPAIFQPGLPKYQELKTPY